jgi:hypothetical protein
MANLIEQIRLYSLSNGGHATNASASGVSLAHFISVVTGQVPVSRPVAVAMAPLIGCTVNQLFREDSDRQLLTRRGALG